MIDDCMNQTKVKRGSELPHAKLTEDDIRLIRSFMAEREQMKAMLRGMTNQAIAEKFDVHRRTIDRITSGETWGHVA
jgi:FixJ family two-component response regulator